jgi:hypothetical protein
LERVSALLGLKKKRDERKSFLPTMDLHRGSALPSEPGLKPGREHYPSKMKIKPDAVASYCRVSERIFGQVSLLLLF